MGGGSPFRGRGLALVAMLGVTVASLGWVLVQVDLGRFLGALAGYRPAALALALLAWFGTLLIRTWRFGLLLPRRPGAVELLSVMSVGSLAMNVVPLRLGELVRPWLLADRHGVPFGESMAVVVVERLLDLVGLLVLVVVVGATADLSGVVVGGVDLLRAGTAAVGTTSAVVLAGIVVLAVFGDRALGPLERALRTVSTPLADAVGRQAGAFVGTARALAGSPRTLLGAVGSTVLLWLVTIGFVAAAISGVDGVDVTLARAASTWAACMVAMVLFPAPGFLGPFEAAVVAALGAQGVDATLAGVAALAMHGTLLGGYAVVGVAFALWEGTSLGEAVRRSADR